MTGWHAIRNICLWLNGPCVLLCSYAKRKQLFIMTTWINIYPRVKSSFMFVRTIYGHIILQQIFIEKIYFVVIRFDLWRQLERLRNYVIIEYGPTYISQYKYWSKDLGKIIRNACKQDELLLKLKKKFYHWKYPKVYQFLPIQLTFKTGLWISVIFITWLIKPTVLDNNSIGGFVYHCNETRSLDKPFLSLM